MGLKDWGSVVKYSWEMRGQTNLSIVLKNEVCCFPKYIYTYIYIYMGFMCGYGEPSIRPSTRET
jgi:hypothetical protein